MSGWNPDEIISFTAPLSTGDAVSHDVHVQGNGPPILILQELPGIGSETLGLVRRFEQAGFRVYLPHLFGTFGKTTLVRNTAHLFCVRREFNIFLRGQQSPISDWLRALVHHIQERENAVGVGVIGMCLTGSFALTLMADDAVLGGVASQPALPLLGGDHLHMSPQDIQEARKAMAEKGPGLAMRYTNDKFAPARLMRALEGAFCEDLASVEYPGTGHSLLTLDFHEAAYQRVEEYFRDRFTQAGTQPRS
jgi:dienelactone hydrolase